MLDQNTKLPLTKPVSIKRPVLEVSGYAKADDTGSQNIAPLLENTTSDPDFASVFELNPPEMGPDIFDGVPVQKFTLEYLIKTIAEVE